MNMRRCEPVVGFLSSYDKRTYWANVITSWYVSGKSLRSFCKVHKIDITRMRRWHYKLNLPRPVKIVDVASDCSVKSKRKFMPINVDELKSHSAKSPSGIVLAVGSKRVLLERDFDEHVLTSLLARLEQESC